MGTLDKRAAALITRWQELKRLREGARGTDGQGTSFFEARKEATGYAGHRVFNGGFGSWCGGWGSRFLHDSTIAMALQTSLNGFMSYLISPTQRWFMLRAGGEVEKGYDADSIYGLNDYFETCQQEMLKVFTNTNFYPSMRTFIADGMVQGTAALLIHEHSNDGSDSPICFKTLDPAEFCIEENSDGRVDTLFREFDLPLSQAYRRYGDKLPRNLIESHKKGADPIKQIVFLEAVFPKGDVLDIDGEPIERNLRSKNSKFSYFLLCRDGDEIIEEGEYADFPFAVQRWERVSEDTPYGIGRVMRLLPEIKALEKNMKLQLIASEKLVNPPITVPMMMRDFDSRPGAVNFGDVSQAPVPLNTVRNYDGFSQETERLRKVIEEGMYTNLFATLMRTPNQYMTATAVNELKSESLSLMSATLNNLQQEVIIPVIHRTYAIMKRAGLLPQLPEEYIKLFGEDIHVELEGVLISRMRDYLKQQGIASGLQFVGQVMQMTSDPNLLLNIDIDKAIRQGAAAQGLPQSLIREQQEVEEMKKQIQQQQEEQRQMQQMQQLSTSMQSLGNAGIDVSQAMQQQQ